MAEHRESLNSLLSRFLDAVSDIDCDRLTTIVTTHFHIEVPGPDYLDISESVTGSEALCHWAKRVNEKCGRLDFLLHRYFENGCELMANGRIQIEMKPRIFVSPCAIHIRTEADQIASFQLLFDTFALQKFRGEAVRGYA